MATIKEISDVWNGNICRRCLNMRYSVKLIQDDCRYGENAICPSCEERHHLVNGLTFTGRRKLRNIDAEEFWNGYDEPSVKESYYFDEDDEDVDLEPVDLWPEEKKRAAGSLGGNILEAFRKRDKRILELEAQLEVLNGRIEELSAAIHGTESYSYDAPGRVNGIRRRKA